MDFDDTPEEAAYRAQVRAWLDANAPRRKSGANQRPTSRAEVDDAKRWQAKKAAAGYAQITWPKAWGGPGGTPIQSVIYAQEEAEYEVPPNPFTIGLGMCVPTILSVADDATKTRFVGPALRGEHIWCQLFSEPSGGSDVANARTRAVRDGDDWVINGQKIWTSGAHYSDYGIVVTRTNPEKPKHQGLTMFWLDMKSPGVEVRPIHQMSGASGFNEVFFTDVRVSDSQRLGDVDDGWRVALITLMNERASVGGVSAAGASYETVMALARQLTTAEGAPMISDGALREKLADWYVQHEGARLTRLRTLTALSRGETPGPENSIVKAVSANLTQDLARQAVELMDQYGVIEDPELAPLGALFQQANLAAPGGRIAGGTDEIMKNILAERVLGLPGDIRVDKSAPFSQLPKGA